jgi:hypothetical protein
VKEYSMDIGHEEEPIELPLPTVPDFTPEPAQQPEPIEPEKVPT